MLSLHFYDRKVAQTLGAQQADANNVQAEVSRGVASKDYMEKILGDLIALAPSKPGVQALLSRNGVTITPANQSAGNNNSGGR